MYIVLKSVGTIDYGSVRFISSSEEDARQYANIMSRNIKDCQFFVAKVID